MDSSLRVEYLFSWIQVEKLITRLLNNTLEDSIIYSNRKKYEKNLCILIGVDNGKLLAMRITHIGNEYYHKLEGLIISQSL